MEILAMNTTDNKDWLDLEIRQLVTDIGVATLSANSAERHYTVTSAENHCQSSMATFKAKINQHIKENYVLKEEVPTPQDKYEQNKTEFIHEIFDSLGCPRRNPSVITAKANVLGYIQEEVVKARFDEVTKLAQAGNEFTKKTGSIEAGWAHIRDLIQRRISELSKGKDKV
jgi:hypothetical protein